MAAYGLLNPGDTLGSYVVQAAVGQGSQGTLYRATDPLHGQPRALKVVRLADEVRRLRFLREARTAAALQHPDIVRLEAYGEQGSMGWLAMAWLSGCDLTHHTRAPHLLPPSLALGIVARVAAALAHAHRQGVIHRDVKPANLRVNLTEGQVAITDFGSAWAEDSFATASGALLGTPLYMAPEQLAGAALDGRADLYALGVVLYELLAGQPPFQAESMGQLMRQVASQAPPDLGLACPSLPPLLQDVVARLLSKSPAARQPDGDRLALELRTAARLLPGQPFAEEVVQT